MAHFRGTIQANGNEASRLGHKTTGLTARVNGWHSGVEVRAVYDSKNDADTFEIYQTGGSNAGMNPRKIGTVSGGKFIAPVL